MKSKDNGRENWVRFTKWLPLSESIIIADIEISPGIIEAWRIHFTKKGIPAKIEIKGKGVFATRALYILPRRWKRGIIKAKGHRVCSGSQEDTL